jgi:hypothetical protein
MAARPRGQRLDRARRQIRASLRVPPHGRGIGRVARAEPRRRAVQPDERFTRVAGVDLRIAGREHGDGERAVHGQS